MEVAILTKNTWLITVIFIFIDTLKDKVVWITGASGGIGEQIALNLSKHGAKIVLSARSKDKLYQVQNRCIGNFFFFWIINLLNICFIYLIEISQGKLTNNDILVLPMDVTNISKHISLFDTVINHFGKVWNILLELKLIYYYLFDYYVYHTKTAKHIMIYNWFETIYKEMHQNAQNNLVLKLYKK